MKSLFIAAVLVSSAFAASAMSGNGEIYPPETAANGPSKTRAEVVAELREAQADGLIAYGNIDPSSAPGRQVSVAGALTRAEVRAEVTKLAAEGNLYHNNQGHGGIYRN